MACQSDKPYPKIRVERRNEEYAILLSSDYAGSASEDTAIHLYLYQALVLKDRYPELSKTLEDISKVEMKHLFLLGKTIESLGGDPMFGEVRKCFLLPWNASAVDYTQDLRTMLEVDIEREENAISNYEKHISMIDDVFIQLLLKRIIEDERIHLAIFHNFYQKLFF